MSGRRGFLAVVGSTMVAGIAGWSTTARHPTLLMPTRAMPRLADPSPPRAGLSTMQQTAKGLITAQALPARYPLLAAQETQMHAFINVRSELPDEFFLDWLEGGLQMVEGCRPGGLIHRAIEAERAEAGA